MPCPIDYEYPEYPQYPEYPEYKDISPNILTEYVEKMFSIKNIVYVVQTPPDKYAYISSYISAGPQTHFGIYKIKNNKELELIYEALLIVYDGCTSYLIDKNIREVLRQNGLNKNEIDLLIKNKYEYITKKIDK